MRTLLLSVSASCRKAVFGPQPQGFRVVGVSKGRQEDTEVGALGWERGEGREAMLGWKVNGEAPAGLRDRFRWLAAATRDLLAQNL